MIYKNRVFIIIVGYALAPPSQLETGTFFRAQSQPNLKTNN